eukprot:NODE_1634_length_887_cov_60.933174_g1278_i0.p1 GENE.NODE_1634_length_887_cov_60.933174_g1278_i0~~NODE_1634_length_887_cov_60.933174_g1278_i0.p1  ORF type:complete len:269 (+),score=57.24 NODE_1634_length_887_cov_60.933174_g1278_i0:79-885(+)
MPTLDDMTPTLTGLLASLQQKVEDIHAQQLLLDSNQQKMEATLLEAIRGTSESTRPATASASSGKTLNHMIDVFKGGSSSVITKANTTRVPSSKLSSLAQRANQFNQHRSLEALVVAGTTPPGRIPKELMFSTVHPYTTPFRRTLHTVIFLCSLIEFFEVTLLAISCNPSTTRPSLFITFFIFTFVLSSIEVFLSFSTPIFKGYELMDDRKHIPYIRQEYLRGWFSFDLLITIPLDLLFVAFSQLGGNASFNVLQCAAPFSSLPCTLR